MSISISSINLSGSNYSIEFDATKIISKRTVLRKGLHRYCENINKQAKTYAPVLTGALRKSGRVEDFTTAGELLYSRVVFGGADVGVPYALRREYENNLHPNTRFYLRRAVENNATVQAFMSAAGLED